MDKADFLDLAASSCNELISLVTEKSSTWDFAYVENNVLVSKKENKVFISYLFEFHFFS